MIDSSFDIWPLNKGICDELGLKILLRVHPYVKENTLPTHPLLNPIQCPNCSAFHTSYFYQNGNLVSCPFCEAIKVKSGSSELNMLDNFCCQSVIQGAKFYVCFILDMNCELSNAKPLKHFLKIAMQAILKDQKFICALLFDKCISFLVVVDGSVKSLSFDFQQSLFNFIDINYLLNDKNNIDSLCEFIDGIESFSGRKPHEIPDLNTFSNFPKHFYFKAMIFSSNYLFSKIIPNVSIDWVSVESSANMCIDGFHLILSNKSIENMELQIQTIVTKYFNRYLFGLKIKIFSSDQIIISPSFIEKKSIPIGYSESVKVIIPRIGSTPKVLIQVVSSYIIFNKKKPISITNVISRVYPTSHDYLPLLRSINPSILRPRFKDQIDKKSFILKVYNIYQNKIVNMLPGSKKNDYYFSIIPKLQWILRFIFKEDISLINSFIIERGHEMIKYCPIVSFWGNQNDKIEEFSLWPEESNILLGKPPIVIVDSFYKISIYMNEELIKGSLLDNALKESFSVRLPIPSFQIHTREKFEIDFHSMTNDSKIIESILIQYLQKN